MGNAIVTPSDISVLDGVNFSYRNDYDLFATYKDKTLTLHSLDVFGNEFKRQDIKFDSKIVCVKQFHKEDSVKVLLQTRKKYDVHILDGDINLYHLVPKKDVAKITPFDDYVYNLEKNVKFGFGTRPIMSLFSNGKYDDIIGIFTTIKGDVLIRLDLATGFVKAVYGNKEFDIYSSKKIIDVVGYNNDVYILYEDGSLFKNEQLLDTNVKLINAFTYNYERLVRYCLRTHIPKTFKKWATTNGVSLGYTQIKCPVSGSVGSGDTDDNWGSQEQEGLFTKKGKYKTIKEEECAFYVKGGDVVSISGHNFVFVDNDYKLIKKCYELDDTNAILLKSDARNKKINPYAYNHLKVLIASDMVFTKIML